MEDNSYKVEFKFINWNDIHQYKLKYSENNKEIIKDLNNEMNITIQSKDFKFKIIDEKIEKCYSADLILNYNNEIIIDLNDNLEGCNIEFILKNVKGKYFKHIYILYNETRYNFQTEYNNLNLSRILLFNIPLKFKIYLADKERKIKKNFQFKVGKPIKELNEGEIKTLGKKIRFV